MAEKLDLPFLGEIPLAAPIRIHSDEGKPIVIADPKSPLSEAFFHVAEKLTEQVKIKGEPSDIKISF